MSESAILQFEGPVLKTPIVWADLLNYLRIYEGLDTKIQLLTVIDEIPPRVRCAHLVGMTNRCEEAAGIKGSVGKTPCVARRALYTAPVSSRVESPTVFFTEGCTFGAVGDGIEGSPENHYCFKFYKKF